MELIWQWKPTDDSREVGSGTKCVVRLWERPQGRHARLVGPVLKVRGAKNARVLTEALNTLGVVASDKGKGREALETERAALPDVREDLVERERRQEPVLR